MLLKHINMRMKLFKSYLNRNNINYDIFVPQIKVSQMFRNGRNN